MTRDELIALHRAMTAKGLEIMQAKNQDYGATDDPFFNFRMAALIKVLPEKGVLLRMQDKMARVVSFIDKGDLAVKEESWHDSLIDLINYAVILDGLLHERAGIKLIGRALADCGTGEG